MNPWRYKCPQPRLAAVGGRTWEVRVLSPLAIHRASGVGATVDAGGAMRELAAIIALIASATQSTAEEVRGLTPKQLLQLLRLWQKVQDEATPDAGKLDAQIRLAVLDDPEMQCDGAVAYAAANAGDYYGCPISQITLGQLVYFLLLKAAYHEFHVEKAGTKVSKAWLERQLQAQSG